MFNKKKFWITCAVMAAAGIVLTTAGVASGGIVNGIQLNSRGLHVYSPDLAGGSGEVLYKEEGRRIEAFDSIEIDLCQADVCIETSDRGEYEISYQVFGDISTDFECRVTDGRLVVAQKSRMNFMNIDFSWLVIGKTYADIEDSYVTVQVPAGKEISVIDVNTESGDLICTDILADRLDVSVEDGDVSLQSSQIQDISAVLDCGNMLADQTSGDRCSVKSEYGDIQMKDLNLAEDLEMSIECGKASFQNVAARDLNLKSSYGNAQADQIELRNMQLHMDTGDCSFADIEIEQCSIKTDYGDVQLSLRKDAADYGYRLKAEYGRITVGGEKMGDSYVTLDDGRQQMIQIECESGDIDIQ